MEKMEKKKFVFYVDEKDFSNRYEEYFNNKKYSDFVIKFEEKDEFIYCHKNILSSGSECTFYFLIIYIKKIFKHYLNLVI
jgi:hypothetical protein